MSCVMLKFLPNLFLRMTYQFVALCGNNLSFAFGFVTAVQNHFEYSNDHVFFSR